MIQETLAERGRGGGVSFSLFYLTRLSCLLNSCQESLMAVEFGQEKSGTGSFRGSGDLCLTKAARLFVFSRPDRETDRAGA